MRDIPKMVEVPKLSHQAIKCINDVCFHNQHFIPGRCEAVIVFGTSREINQKQIPQALTFACQLFSPQVVYLTGGETSERGIESVNILKAIKAYGNFTHVEFRLDRTSLHTKENVERAIELGLGTHKNLVFVTKSPHGGRSKLTLKKLLPHATIRGTCYDPLFTPDFTVRRDNWYHNETLRKMMWGEFLRIECYGKRGDIDYPSEVREKVERVRQLIGAE